MRRKALKQKKIWNPALFGIQNPLSWNPESSTRNPESTGWNPDSRTVMDSLTWGENHDPIKTFCHLLPRKRGSVVFHWFKANEGTAVLKTYGETGLSAWTILTFHSGL